VTEPETPPPVDEREPRAAPLILASLGCIVVMALVCVAAFFLWRIFV